MHFCNNNAFKKYRIISVFLLASALMIGCLLFATSKSASFTELILIWNTSLSVEDAEQYLAAHYPELSLSAHDADLSLCHVETKHISHSVLRRLNRDDAILLAEPDYSMELMETTLPDDPYLPSLWSYENTGSFPHYYETLSINQPSTKGIDMNIPEAWATFPFKKEETNTVLVAVIDTGIDYRHPDLRNAMWKNEGEIPNNNIDDDNNGYIDDIYGWDFYHQDNSVCHYITTEYGYAANPDDNDNHGTHCAGIIAATADNSIGIAGIAGNTNTKLMSLKIHGGTNGNGSVFKAIQAIRYAESMGADICNMSWGTYNYSEALELVIKESSMLFVTAAGNQGGNNNSSAVFPASFRLPNLISVAFVDYNGNLDSTSNYGLSTVDIAAPGKDIYSTFVGSYGYASGSSMAAPHVSGLAALIYAGCDHVYPAQVKELIINTLQPLETLDGYVIHPGIPDAFAAIQSMELLQGDNTAPLLSIQSSFEKGMIRLTTSAYDPGGSGVKKIRYLYGSRTIEDFQSNTAPGATTGFSILLTKPGYYTFYVEDYARNSSIHHYYIEEDITPPELAASYTVSDDLSTFHICLTATDSESDVKTIKYLIGEQTKEAFQTGGDTLSAFYATHEFDVSTEVTALTVYLSDYRGNETTYTIYPKIIPATSVHLTVNERSITLYETIRLHAIAFPLDTTDRILFYSDNPSVLIVEKDGRITGIAEGTAHMIAKSTSGVEAVCKITVKAE